MALTQGQPDTPVWREHLADRQNPYRYLDHQRGVLGVLRVRLIEGNDLGGTLEQSKSISPQVIIKIGDEVARSSVAQHNRNASWRERFTFDLKKGVLQEGAPVLVIFQVIEASWIAVRTPKVLGTGSLDILDLLNGSRGSQILDEWVELSPAGGAVHAVIEYEPNGIEPQINDVVFFEAFARSQRSLVFPLNEPMIVRAVAGAYLLVGLNMPRARAAGVKEFRPTNEIRLKVHRNTVFVIERLTVLDSAWHYVLDAKDALQETAPVRWTRRKVKPFAAYVIVLARPALASMHLFYAAARMAFRSSLAAVSGGAGVFLQHDDRHF